MTDMDPVDVTDAYSLRVRTTPCPRCGEPGMTVIRRFGFQLGKPLPRGQERTYEGTLVANDYLEHGDCGQVAVATGVVDDGDKHRMVFELLKEDDDGD